MKNYAYITLLTNDDYLPGVLLLREGLRMTHSEYPLITMVTEDVSEESLDTLQRYSVETRLVPKIQLPEKILKYDQELNPRITETWRYVFSKFNIFKFTEFDKVIFLDADLMIMKNLDHCFEYPHMTAALDGEYVNLWEGWPHFNSGFMVIEPDETLPEKLIQFSEELDLDTIKDGYGNKYVLADQEILNLYYRDWVDQPEKHLSKYYNVFPPHCSEQAYDDLKANAYFVHFVGCKPWANLQLDTKLGSTIVHPWAVDPVPIVKKLFVEASAILSASQQFPDVDWVTMETSGKHDYNCAIVALERFCNPQIANDYIQKALLKSPGDEMFIKYSTQVKTCLKLQKLKPDILNFLSELLQDQTEKGICTRLVYDYITVLSVYVWTLTEYRVAEKFYNTFFNSLLQ